MPQRQRTVDDLVDQVRSQLDEDNVETIDTSSDILPALNRAQDYAANILARHYEDPLLTKSTVDIVGGTQEYDIPEDAFENRLEKVEIEISGTFVELERLSYRDSSRYETSTNSDVPYYYVVVGSKFRLVPTPSGTYDARVWYLKSPERLVQPQGRIQVVNSGSNYVVVDSVGSTVTTESDNLASYLNLIDGQSGRVKATVQVKTVTDNRVTFKTTPSRSTVLNRTVSSSLPTTLELDDYLAPVQGTCVEELGRPTSNFLIQYAVAELQRKLGGPADMEHRILEKFEQQVERSWVGREQQLRVKKRNKNWDLPHRRWYYARGD